MQIIYPSQLFHPTIPDETFEQEFYCAQQQGIHCLLLSSDAAAMGEYRFSAPFEAEVPVIWRGWMMAGDEYQQLHQAVAKRGATLMTSPEDYLRSHHLTGWYSLCRDFTPETHITERDADFDKLVEELQWPAYFVKDYVKSLTTQRGSVAHNAGEIREIIALLEKFRGQIEGGICLRRFEHFDDQSEKRYFVLNKRIYASDDTIPEQVIAIAQRIERPFYSIDMAINDSGKLRLIEIGDGQVSDIKEWAVERFVQMLLSSVDT
jgi:hypothetical protein